MVRSPGRYGTKYFVPFLFMYKKLSLFTIYAIFLLIFVGGVVRASGSGMGCPDWPKCFGQWVPPTDVSELPLNYQEIFGAKLKGEVQFNAFKTWTEYVNRLLGVLIGLLIIGSFISSIKDYWKSNKTIVFFSGLALVLVILEGWIGAKVVATELNPVLITVHMLLAIGVVFSLIYALHLAHLIDTNSGYTNQEYKFIVLLLMLVSFGQLILGTALREKVDEAYLSGLSRTDWLSNTGGEFYFHIGLGTALLIGHLFLWLKSKGMSNDLRSKGLIKYLSIIVLLEYSFGAILGLLKMPAVIQPFHLTLGTIILGIQFILILLFGKKSSL